MSGVKWGGEERRGERGVPLPLLQTSDEELRTFIFMPPGVKAVAVTQDQNWDKLRREKEAV